MEGRRESRCEFRSPSTDVQCEAGVEIPVETARDVQRVAGMPDWRDLEGRARSAASWSCCGDGGRTRWSRKTCRELPEKRMRKASFCLAVGLEVGAEESNRPEKG